MSFISSLSERNRARAERAGNTPLLSVRNVSVHFGGITALDQISFDVRRGTICGIIGPNGAGKTTLFNCLNGLYTVGAGEVLFNGQSLLNLPPHQMAELGLGRTFQNLALFASMSVRRNILVGAHCRTWGGFVTEALRFGRVRREEEAQNRIAEEIIHFLDLAAVAEKLPPSLPFATLKRVELARALASQPDLLLLDEPAAGLNHESVEDLITLVKRISSELRITVLLVEHHMNMVMRISDQVVALDFGRKIADGPPGEVRKHPCVIAAYLGTMA